MQKSRRSPDDFLASLSTDVQTPMTILDAAITKALPGRARTLWEGTFWGGASQAIIGYGDIVQRRPRGLDVEWFLVGLARQKRYFSIYINAVEDGEYVGARYADRLGKVKVGASSISFATLLDVNLGALDTLLRRAHDLTGPDVTRKGARVARRPRT